MRAFALSRPTRRVSSGTATCSALTYYSSFSAEPSTKKNCKQHGKQMRRKCGGPTTGIGSTNCVYTAEAVLRLQARKCTRLRRNFQSMDRNISGTGSLLWAWSASASSVRMREMVQRVRESAKYMAWKEVGPLKRVQQWNVWAVAKHYRVTHSMPSA